MTHLFILGATGSIGLQTIEVIEHNTDFRLIGVSLGSDHVKNQALLDRFDVTIACLRHPLDIERYQHRYPDIEFTFGDEGLMRVASYPSKGILVNALSGSAGLKPTIAAIESGKDIALANKETLVMAGPIIKALVKTHNVRLLPIDSEHSAIWQLLEGEHPADIAKIVITASGGAFRNKDRDALHHVTPEEALAHPNWRMGDKITIDSATMMNKGLEVIEAHHLFDLPYDQIETILHDESIVHGMVYFKDGSIKASLGPSDMRIPIGYALGYPNRMATEISPYELSALHFKPMDFNRFPLLALAYQVGRQGGIAPTVMNAANEAAVQLFLKGKISFLMIEEIIQDAVLNHQPIDASSIQDIIKTDRDIQTSIRSKYE